MSLAATELAVETPLPQLPKLRRMPVPVREPRAMRRVHGGETVPTIPQAQGTLALVLPDDADLDDHEAVGTADESAAEPRGWATTLLTAALEVAAGVRSPLQLVRWTSLDVQAALARRGALAARARRAGAVRGVGTVRGPGAIRGTSSPARPAPGRGGRPQLRTIRMSSPCAGVYEVTAVVADAGRVRAVAMRMEGTDGRWRVTAMDIG